MALEDTSDVQVDHHQPVIPAFDAHTWLEDLKRTQPDRLARRTAAQSDRPLPARIARWHAALPPNARAADRTMDEFVAVFRAATSEIGMALHSLGWTRRRVWAGRGPYRRVWAPPE